MMLAFFDHNGKGLYTTGLGHQVMLCIKPVPLLVKDYRSLLVMKILKAMVTWEQNYMMLLQGKYWHIYL